MPGDGYSRHMASKVKLFVIDTGQLITRAVADSLDYQDGSRR